jgi:hypothetical protein
MSTQKSNHGNLPPPSWIETINTPSGRNTFVDNWLRSVHAAHLFLPDSDHEAQLRFLCERLCAALFSALDSAIWDARQPAFRDTVKTVSVLAGWLAETQASASTPIGLLYHMRHSLLEQSGQKKALGEQLDALFFQLTTSAVESYFSNRQSTQRQQHQEMLERSTPLIRVRPDLPVVLWVGTPNAAVISSVLDRLLVEIVRNAAPAVLLDATHLDDEACAAPLSNALADFSQNKRIRTRPIHLVGISAALQETLRSQATPPDRYHFHPSLAAALEAISTQ